MDYSGAQVWKVSTEKSGVRGILGRLRRRNRTLYFLFIIISLIFLIITLYILTVISTWGGNHTYVDVFVKPNAVQNVTRIFNRENISYDVIIEDLQKRINEENPPLDENEIELQDRRGLLY